MFLFLLSLLLTTTLHVQNFMLLKGKELGLGFRVSKELVSID
jgi:hypothetical protein